MFTSRRALFVWFLVLAALFGLVAAQTLANARQFVLTNHDSDLFSFGFDVFVLVVLLTTIVVTVRRAFPTNKL